MSKPNIKVFINKKTIPWNDRGFNYGDGLFETVLVKKNKPIFLNDHIKRMHNGCVILGITRPPVNLIKKSIQSCIGKTSECIIKLIFTRGLSDFGYKIKPGIPPNLYLFKIIKYRKTLDHKVARLGYSDYRLKKNAQLSKIKHLGRLEQVYVAKDLLKHDKYSDLIVLDEKDRVIECLSSNIFFVHSMKNPPVFETPKIEDSGIEGVLRNKVIKYLKKRMFQVKIKDIGFRKISSFDSCFTTNSVQGVIFINQIGKKKFLKPKFLYNELKGFIYTK